MAKRFHLEQTKVSFSKRTLKKFAPFIAETCEKLERRENSSFLSFREYREYLVFSWPTILERFISARVNQISRRVGNRYFTSSHARGRGIANKDRTTRILNIQSVPSNPLVADSYSFPFDSSLHSKMTLNKGLRLRSSKDAK